MAHYYVKCREAILKDYPVAGADERVGSADSENETDSNDHLIFFIRVTVKLIVVSVSTVWHCDDSYIYI